jgi:hypothetical protein
LCVRILGVGLVGPGMIDWATTAPRLAQADPWEFAQTLLPSPQRLPAAERRRAGMGVKLAIAAADQACAAAGAEPSTLATVFASSTSDPSNCHALCEALALPERFVSPTRFTNSVHNAPSGYWHIATQAKRPSTSLSAYDGSFAAGLLEAAVQCLSGQDKVLLVASDVPYPAPLHVLRPVLDSFAVALLLEPGPLPEQRAPAGDSDGPPASARLEIRLIGAEAPPTVCQDAVLESIRGGIPSARGLPLLQALARRDFSPEGIVVEGLPHHALHLRLMP